MIKTSRIHAFTPILLLALLCQMLVVPMLNVVPSAQAADPTILTTPKWTVTGQPEGESGVLIADINKDGREEVIRAASGWIRVFSGTNGAILWQKSDAALSTMAKPQMADLDGDGFLEIIVNIARGVMAWRFPSGVISNGVQYWRRNDLSSSANHWSSPVVGIIDGSGRPTVFVGGEDAESGNLGGRITALRYDGTVLRQAFTWRPCFGGLSLADTDSDGHFELLQGDRNGGYNDGGYGRGVRCFWAENLTTKWERPEVLCSSHCPILVDVNKDGILEVIAGQTGDLCVIDSRDGSYIHPITDDTNAFPIHFQPSVYDIDHDGNPELLMADGHDNTADDVVIWDLTQWKQDGRVSIGKCYYGPKAADVTGDGVMELIACSYGGIYIIDHANFTVLDSVTNLGPNTYATRLTYAVVNDIDGDGLAELVVSSYSGSIWAFDTRAPKSNPRARSEVQHYSEMRLGAAEYVGAPGNTANPLILNAFPSDKSANVPLSLSALTFTLKDYQNNLMSYSVTTSPNIGSWSGTNVASGTTISLDPSSLSYATTYTWRVNVTDSAAHLTSRSFRFRTQFASVLNTAPTQGTPRLVSSSTTPAAGDTLTCYNQSTYDANGNPVTNIYNWYRDDVSYTNLLLPFDTRNEVTAKDYSGYGNDGTVNGATWTSAGRIGGCYEFTSGSNIVVPYSTRLDGGGTWSGITVEQWIYFSVDQDGTRTIAKTFSYEIGFQSGSPNRLYATIWTKGQGCSTTSSYTLSKNTWYHVVMTYKDGVGLRLYVNGVLRASGGGSGQVQSGATIGPFLGQNNPEPLYIGWFNSFRGKIDEVRIYPKALSQAQITQRYSETSGANSKLTSPETVGGVWKCQVTPNDRYADGTAKVSNTITLPNRSPTASNLRFTSRSGLQFLTTDDLRGAYDYSDPDGDLEAGTEIRWYRNGALQTSLNNLLVVPQTATSTGDTWYFTVRPKDGKVFGTTKTSSSGTIIQNSAPTQGTPSISGVRDDAKLVCTPQATADGNNDKVANIYNWYKGGVSFSNLLLPFDTNNGVTAEDYSGYNNDGTVYGATWTSNGIVGGAYSFNGDDVITVADSASLGNAGSWSQITVEYWVYPSVDQRGARILNKNGGAAGDSGNYMTGINTDASGPANVIFFGVTAADEYEETYSNTDTVIPTGSWSHIVGTYKSGEGIKLYINGVLKSSTAGITGKIDASIGEPLFIGYSSRTPGTANRYFNGRLDEIRIYPTALSASQIYQNYIDQKNGLSSTATIVPEETSVGQTWRCQVTPNDSWQDGTTSQTSQITITSAGTAYTLTIIISGSGHVNLSPSKTSYSYGEVVQLTAIPSNYRWVFDHWGGALTGTASPGTIVMNSGKTVYAYFRKI